MFLNCHSYHSLRYGTISVDELVQQAITFKLRTLALTDINTITGIYDFYKLCRENSFKPVVGVDVRVQNHQYYICLAKNQKAIGNINRMLSAYNCDNIEIPKHNPKLAQTIIIYPIHNIPEELSEDEYIGVRPEELNFLVRPELKKLIAKMVILQPVTFKTKQEYNLHRILRAIDKNTLISMLNENDCCRTTETFISKKSILDLFRNYPELISNTAEVIKKCSFEFDFSTPKNKQYYTDSRENDFTLLTKLAYEGLTRRYPKHNVESDSKSRERTYSNRSAKVQWVFSYYMGHYTVQ